LTSGLALTTSGCRGVDDRSEMLGRVCVGRFDEVGVDAERCGRARMAEASAHRLHVFSAREKHRRGEVTEVVEAHAFEAEVVA
jgi:hypothetical protein